jgi:hypothetical protein
MFFSVVTQLFRILLILVFLCQHIAMASEPIVLHLPDDSHAMLVSVNQPHNHDSHHHDDHEEAHSIDWSSDEHTSSSPDVGIEIHDDSAHEHAKHMHGHADCPNQLFIFATVPAGNECYLHQSQLTGITHTPPVPPPNA